MQRRGEHLTLRGLGLLDGARKPAGHSPKLVVAFPPVCDSGVEFKYTRAFEYQIGSFDVSVTPAGHLADAPRAAVAVCWKRDRREARRWWRPSRPTCLPHRCVDERPEGV